LTYEGLYSELQYNRIVINHLSNAIVCQLSHKLTPKSRAQWKERRVKEERWRCNANAPCQALKYFDGAAIRVLGPFAADPLTTINKTGEAE